MNTRLLPAITLCLTCAGLAPFERAAQANPTTIAASNLAADSFPVRVDPRVEIVMTIFRLGGAGEFNMDASTSAYTKAIDDYFAKHKDHAAVKAVERLRAEKSIGFNAVPDFAIRLKDWHSGEFLVPIDPIPEGMDKRWTPAAAREFAGLVRDFARDTEYGAFLELQAPTFARAEASFSRLLATHPFRTIIESFFGEKIGEGSYAVAGLLAGGGNYGMSIRFPDGRLAVLPIIGVSEWEPDGTPRFSESDLDTVVHEFCHPFANPLVDLAANELLPAAGVLHERHRDAFADQAYGDAKTVMYESLVRACVVRIMNRVGGPERSLLQRRYEIGRAFWFTPALESALERYEADRATFPTLRSFMPEITAALKDARAIIAAQEANLPKVVSIQPADGSTGLKRDVEFRFVFDRPMDKASRGLNVGDAKFERVVPGSFDESGTVYTTVLRFEPGRTITARLNANGSGLASSEGYPLATTAFTFTIAGEETPQPK